MVAFCVWDCCCLARRTNPSHPSITGLVELSFNLYITEPLPGSMCDCPPVYMLQCPHVVYTTKTIRLSSSDKRAAYMHGRSLAGVAHVCHAHHWHVVNSELYPVLSKGLSLKASPMYASYNETMLKKNSLVVSWKTESHTRKICSLSFW